MGLHNDFSWCYTKALLPASSEQGTHAVVQLCWFGFQVEARICSFLRRNPSRYHSKTKPSLVSRFWKSLCTEFWWLSKRHSQNFEHFLVCLLWTKQQYILLADSTGQTDNAQANVQPKCPSGPTQFLSAWQLMGNTLIQIQKRGRRRGHDLEASPYPACVVIHPCEGLYSINNFSYKKKWIKLKSFQLASLPPFSWIPNFFIFLKYIKNDHSFKIYIAF